MHFDLGKIKQCIGNFIKLRPVILDILPGREMSVSLVITTRDIAKLAQLLRAQRSIGNSNAQHVGMQLKVNTVHQAQWAKLVFGNIARKTTFYLFTELLGTFQHQLAVKIIIAIHDVSSPYPA